jgi:hypothetical protein
VAYGARLESVLGASPRGFESPILRRCDESDDWSQMSGALCDSCFLFRPPSCWGELVSPVGFVGFDEVLAEDFSAAFVGDGEVGLVGVEDHGRVSVAAIKRSAPVKWMVFLAMHPLTSWRKHFLQVKS